MCVCVPLNYLTCEKNGAIEMQHNNNNNNRQDTCARAEGEWEAMSHKV